MALLLVGMVLTAAAQFPVSNLAGRIYHDQLPNCQLDAQDVSLENWIVSALGTDTFYASTDPSGKYEFQLPNGDYKVEFRIPNALWKAACPPLDSVRILGVNDSFTANLPLVGDSIICADLWVDVVSPAIDSCQPNVFTVRYCNLGNIATHNPILEVVVDSGLVLDSSSVPWDLPQSGNSYMFHLDTLDVNACAQFLLYTRHDCAQRPGNASLGVQVMVQQDSLCPDLPFKRQESRVALNAACLDGDTIVFTVRNDGLDDMFGPTTLDLIEDILLVARIDTILLKVNQTMEIRWPANGATYRAIAPQVLGGSDLSKPSLAVEGCGRDSSGDYSRGFVKLFANDDLERFLEKEIRPGTGRLSGSGVLAHPTGVPGQRFIEGDDPIEYLLYHENPGGAAISALEFNNVLSDYVNPASVQIGAASHDYSFELTGTGQLKFRMQNIPAGAEMIFVKFKVEQKRANSNGTIIRNEANVRVDANPAINLNSEEHTVGKINETYLILDTTSSQPNDTTSLGSIELAGMRVLVFPQPMQGNQLNFQLQGLKIPADVQLEIFDLLGQRAVVKVFDVDGRSKVLRNELGAKGVYIYRIQTSDQLITTGKLILPH